MKNIDVHDKKVLGALIVQHFCALITQDIYIYILCLSGDDMTHVLLSSITD